MRRGNAARCGFELNLRCVATLLAGALSSPSSSPFLPERGPCGPLCGSAPASAGVTFRNEMVFVPAALSSIVRGVEFEVELRGRQTRGIVLAEVLVRHYGATDESKSLLETFERYAAEIRSLAQGSIRGALPEIVVVSEKSFGGDTLV